MKLDSCLTKRILAAPAAAVAMLMLAACGASEKGVVEGPAGVPAITLSEGACNNTCPIYDMTLHPDGAYSLNGQKFVRTTGLTEGNIGEEAWAEAVAVLERGKFWTVEPIQTPKNVSPCFEGGPTVRVTWRTEAGKEKTLVFDGGCEVHETRGLIAALRTALKFDDLVWTSEKFEWTEGGGTPLRND